MSAGVFPGSFNPPTLGHLAIAEAAVAVHGLSRLDLVISRHALAKGVVERPRLEDRVEVLVASVAHLDQMRVQVTDLQLIADIAGGYEVVVMGADKWHQVNDPAFYASPAARDEAVESLPQLAIAGRGDLDVPPGSLLTLPGRFDHVSSSAARTGRPELMTPAAAAFDRRSGAWSDPARYDRWVGRSP